MHLVGKSVYTVITIFVLGFSSIAGAANCEVYDVLKVKAKAIDDSYLKSVGAIRCQKTGPDCHCFLVPGGDAELFDALDVEEKNITPKGMLGSVTTQKQVKDLVCTKRAVVHPNAKPKVTCGFDYSPTDSPTTGVK